jgi:DNA-binding CsgD family transcriptional regulator
MKLMTRRANKELQRVKKEKELQLKEQEATFAAEKEKKEKEVVKLRNQQLEMELKHKASEIADSTMNLVRKNDMLQAIDDSMEDLSEGIRREDSKASLTKKISDIRKEIYLHQNDDENWDKFEQNFNLVYDNFMAKLTARYPNLKLNDIKLCAYLKMGLSSKEIASLLNTAVRSVETARYRLRKKLNLNSGENLSDFIQKLE